MTYKKRYKNKKTVKRKKRGGGPLLALKALKTASTVIPGAAAGIPSLPAGIPSLPAGIPSLPAGIPSLPAGVPSLSTGLSSAAAGVPSANGSGSSGLLGAMSKVEGAKMPLTPSGTASLANTVGANISTTSVMSKLKKPSFSTSPYIIAAEFILNQTTKARLNYSLISKLFKAPSLRENKYKKQIIELSVSDKENFKCACKLIYLYFYDEYASNISFMIDNSQDMDNMCKIFYIIKQQIIIYNSSKKRLLSHFNEIFKNNNNFSKLYNENLLNVETNCIIMRSKIRELFKRDNNDYSYIILDLLNDLLKESSLIFINIMDEIKKNKQKKMCDISTEMPNILEDCIEKNTYDKAYNALHPI